MMKENRGIALISLGVVIIILLILAGTGIQASNLVINDFLNDKMRVELGIVRQAVAEQYMKAAAVNKLNIEKDNNQVSFWVGAKLHNISEEYLPDNNAVFESSEDSAKFEEFKNYSSDNVDYQEEIYYKLNFKDLEEIGVTNANDEYIVNYKTKEVYNCTRKINEDLQVLYLSGE